MRWQTAKFRLLVLILVLSTVHALAQGPANHASSTPQPKPERRFLTWKVTSPATTAYLVGSMHIISKDVYPLPAPVEKAFAESAILGVELDVKRIDPAKMQALVQQHALYGADDKLSKHLSKETAASLTEFCTKYEVPCAMFDPLRPWLVGMMVAIIAMQKAGADPQSGIDMHFLNGVKDTQRIVELETAEYQVGLLASRPADEQEKALGYSLNNIGKIREIEKAYLAGDTDALVKIMTDTPFSDFMKKMIDERNVKMAEKIDGYLKTKDSYFVVVGAAHVIGEKGIAKLLEDKGYKVERMSFQW